MAEQQISVTVDSVVFCNLKDHYKVLLIKRKNDPFKGQWALPGGFVEKEETLEKAAIRELNEETGVKVDYMEQIKAFGDPGRDPRGRMISVAFLSQIHCEEDLKASDDASKAKWFRVDELPDMDLAFDHDEIINVAQQYL